MFRTTLDKLMAIREEKKTADGGFTLIELLVVVVIIGILVAIAIPLYLNYEKGANQKQLKSDIRNAVTAVQACYADNNNTLPATATFSSTNNAFAEKGCAADTVVVSNGTTTLVYTPNTTANSYTIEGTDQQKDDYTYSSATGNIS